MRAPASSVMGLKRAFPLVLVLNSLPPKARSWTRWNSSPAPQFMRVASRRFGGGGSPAGLAMLDSVCLILRRSDHEVGPCRQQILRALVVQKAVESRKPEGGTPAALRLAEDLQDFGKCLIRTIAFYGVERIAGEVVDAFVLEGEDGPVPLPFVRLGAGVLGAVPGHLGDVAGGQEVAAPQNGGLGIDHHPGLGERRVGDGDVGEKRSDDLFQGVALALADELGQEGRHLTEDSLEDELLAVVCEGNGEGAGYGGSVEPFADLGTAPHHHLGKGLTELICLS